MLGQQQEQQEQQQQEQQVQQQVQQQQELGLDDPQLCGRVVKVLSQAFTYMCLRGHKYAAITTYDCTWLLCCEADNILQVSQGFGREDVDPTPREVRSSMPSSTLVAAHF